MTAAGRATHICGAGLLHRGKVRRALGERRAAIACPGLPALECFRPK